MSGSIGALYQDVILEHCKRPRNRRVPAQAHQRARGENPLCGDHIDVYVRLEHGRIQDVAFGGVGCAVATASASLMTEAMMGVDRTQAQRLIERFEHMLAAPGVAPDPEMGPLRALHGVHDYPGRLQCAGLAWDALRAALRAGDTDTEPVPAGAGIAP
jgi:nitrogen fixation NifU-like protein